MESDAVLREAVVQALPGADDTSVDLITAVTGLLAAVAYADRELSDEELTHLKSELSRLNGFSPDKVEAVASLLAEHALRLNTSFVPRFTRTLREQLEEPHRCEVLDSLIGMAAADGVITHDEVVSLRNLSNALGLTQAHYNQLQEKYVDKLKLG